MPAEGGAGFPELSALGKRIELLRISRGLTKQQLARSAGTSRQQLWRVMTGKSELTSSLGFRLSQVLQVDGHFLTGSGALPAGCVLPATFSLPAGDAAHRAPASLAEYASDPAAIERTFGTLPPGEAGRRLKRALLNAVEDLAGAEGLRLPPAFFALRGRVLNGDL